MRHRSIVSAFISSLALAGACDTGTQYSLRDTEGSSYRASCRDGACREEVSSPMGPRPEPGCQAGAHAGFALAGAHVVSACHACVSSEGRALRHDLTRCRVITCEHPRDCPPWHRGREVACREGICVEKLAAGEAPALDRVSATALCMSGAGPTSGERFALVSDRLAMAQAACDARGRCAQPAGCRAFPR